MSRADLPYADTAGRGTGHDRATDDAGDGWRCDSAYVKRLRGVVGAAVLGVALTGALTGCDTVQVSGSTGVALSPEGHLVLVFAMCQGRIDRAVIYRAATGADDMADETEAADPTVTIGRWLASTSVVPENAEDASLDTQRPGAPWALARRTEQLRPDVTYTAVGGTRDSSWYSGHVEFTLARVQALGPGQVLSQQYDEKADTFRDVVTPYATFRERSCGPDIVASATG